MASGVNFGTQQYFGFDPRTIPGCGLWLDAADARTLTTSGGGNVTQWADKSGVGANMTPLGTNSNATIQTNYQNGLSAVNFAGLNQYQSPANTGVYPSDVYILVALKTLTRMDIISIGPTSTDNFNSLTFGEHTALRWHNGSSGFARTPATVSPTNETSTSLLLMNWSLSNNNFVIRRNGTQLSSTASYTYTPTAGAIIQLGFRHQNFGTNLAINAYVAEVVTYNRQLDLAERQQVEGYLAWKWALNSSLATSHPYRYVPPIMRTFQPVDVPGGALLWLDAADTRTITGSTVTQWTDKSGRGSNATTGLGSVVAGTAINSLNTLRFGLNTTLNLSNFVMPSAQTSVFYVFKGITSNASGGTGYFIFSRTTDNFLVYSGNEQFFAYQNPGAGRSYIGLMGPGGERNWGNLSTTAFFNAVNVISTTGISYASSNGLSLPLVASSNVSNTVFTASTYQISSSRTVGDVFTYDLGELIVCDGTLSTAAAQQMEGYLAWKWGVMRSLPTTHPYYNALPSTPLFVPTMFANCALWLDGADSSTITIVSSAVTTWSDKSGNGRNATAGLGNTVDGNGGLNFNGVGTYYNTSYTAVPGAETVFIVASSAGTADVNYVILGATDANGRQLSLPKSGSVIGIRWEKTGTPAVGYAQTNGIQSNVRFLTSAVFTGTAGTTGLNGGTQSTSASFSFSGTTTTRIGTGFNGSFFNGVIHEIVIYSIALTESQRQRVEGYLAWKWGLRLSLPSTHPYSNFRP